MKLGVASLARLSREVPVEVDDEHEHTDDDAPTRYDRELELSS